MPKIGSIGERLDIVLRQGSTLGPFIVTLTNPNGTPVDLTGATIEGQVRKNATDAGTPVATFDIVYINRLAGQFSFGMSKATTVSIPAGEYQQDEASQYKWDMELTDSLTRCIPLYYGNFENFREVTRA